MGRFGRDIDSLGGLRQNEKNRPNILYVFSDQQRYSALGANGNNVVRTPVLDAMAAEGMVCDTCISNHPLCSPYRALLLTGQYGWMAQRRHRQRVSS
jgi:arylsulfatase A-like enzyme